MVRLSTLIDAPPPVVSVLLVTTHVQTSTPLKTIAQTGNKEGNIVSENFQDSKGTRMKGLPSKALVSAWITGTWFFLAVET